MPQFRAAAVNWRASWSLLSPLGLTQIASRAEWIFPTSVLSMIVPQTESVPPKASRTASVMFTLLDFSVPPCVPQNPGVRQISSLLQEGSLVGSGVKTHPLVGSQVSSVHALLSLQVRGVPPLQPDCTVVEAVN